MRKELIDNIINEADGMKYCDFCRLLSVIYWNWGGEGLNSVFVISHIKFIRATDFKRINIFVKFRITIRLYFLFF